MTQFSWMPVTRALSQESILQPVYHIFINDTDNGTEHSLSKIADDKKLGGVAGAPDGCAATQRGVNRLEKWVSGIS